MKPLPSLLALIGLALLFPTRADAIVYHFKASAIFPVQTEEPDLRNPGGTIVRKQNLGTKEIVNLAMGNAIGCKHDKELVLAVEMDTANPNTAKLVAFHTRYLVNYATVLTLLDPLDVNMASKDGEKGTGNGLSRGRINATPGTPNTRFLQTDVCGAATAGYTPGAHGPTFKMSMTSIVGPIQAVLEFSPLEGLIIKGSFRAGGKPLDP